MRPRNPDTRPVAGAAEAVARHAEVDAEDDALGEPTAEEPPSLGVAEVQGNTPAHVPLQDVEPL